MEDELIRLQEQLSFYLKKCSELQKENLRLKKQGQVIDSEYIEEIRDLEEVKKEIECFNSLPKDEKKSYKFKDDSLYKIQEFFRNSNAGHKSADSKKLKLKDAEIEKLREELAKLKNHYESNN